MEHPSIIFKIVCPDRPGLVSKLTSWIANYGGNIKHSDHHTDQDAGLFLSRIEWNSTLSVVNRRDIYDKFQEIAIAGTCDDENSSDCRDRIDAETPGDLLTKLKSEIERIVASRLSFTAPSITAELSGEEGGSLFQAQFKYALHGEW